MESFQIICDMSSASRVGSSCAFDVLRIKHLNNSTSVLIATPKRPKSANLKTLYCLLCQFSHQVSPMSSAGNGTSFLCKTETRCLQFIVERIENGSNIQSLQ